MRIVILIPALSHLAAIAVPFALQHRLPDPVAVHFVDGRPDASAPLWATIMEDLALGSLGWLILGLVAWLRPIGSIGRRSGAGGALGVVVLLDMAVIMGTVASNLDAEIWQEAYSPSYASTVVIGSAVVAMLFGALAVSPLVRSADDGDVLPEDPVTGPPRTGQTVWLGSARNPAFYRKTLAATCIMVVLAVVGTWWMAVPALLSLLTLHLWSGVIAVFNGRTLAVRGRLPFMPNRRISLSRIETAEVVQVNPREWGWGWRLRSLRKHSVVIRKGEGLLVALRDGGEFVVTVDDAALGAEEIRRALRAETAVDGRSPARGNGPALPPATGGGPARPPAGGGPALPPATT
ncbi:hypothetical protein ACIHFD_29790 [Nonomuraea sp. NPDC051941]|uniref:hypothetical protein n=1 Tax=Nonomuraea sp. NPDC051941 TaxID=3364373 RepID=UPI0037C54D6D